jgi:hypothetical protein
MKNKSAKRTKSKLVHDAKPVVMDFGTRKISNQNFSKMIALPKTALANCGKDSARVHVQLVQDSKEKYIKLTPVSEKENGGEVH